MHIFSKSNDALFVACTHISSRLYNHVRVAVIRLRWGHSACGGRASGPAHCTMGDRRDVQAAGALEEYIKDMVPPPEISFLDSNYTASSLLQYYKSNLATALSTLSTSSLPLYNKCRSTLNHLSNTTPNTQKSCTDSVSEPDLGTATHAATGTATRAATGTATRAATGRTTTPYASPPALAHGDATACYDRMRRRNTISAETYGGHRPRGGDMLDSPASNFSVSFRCVGVGIRG